MITDHNYFQAFLLLSIQLLLSSTPIIGQHSSELKSDSSGVQIRCFENERQALLEFKQDIIDEYGRLSTWGIEENKRDCCKWSGVYCHNQTNHVTRLDLRAPSSELDYYWGSDVPLRGKIISPSLLELQHLTYLDLSLNDFYGTPIPEFIGSINKLHYLNLDSANFSGLIPHHIGNLSKLQYLNLESRYWSLYSRNLEWLSRLHDLKYINLNFVNLSMATNWLQAISKLNSIKEMHMVFTLLPEIIPSFTFINTSTSTLAVLDLSENIHISSSTFHWFLNFSSSLTHIYLFDNNISGTIPPALGNMMSLEYLYLSGNSLEGGIPKSFGNMSSLIHLDLSDHNRLSGQLSEVMMNLSGPIERKLEYLDLTGNMINGSFPDVSRFSSLKTLKLSKNQLKGCILKICLQLPNLVSLHLSHNNLTGSLLDFSFCSSLKELYLDNNKFNGTLSKSIGSLSNLEHLYLGSNLLEGIITEDHFFNLSRLRSLDLSSNSLLKLKFSHQWVPPFQLGYVSLSSCELGPQFPKWIQNQKKLIYLDVSNARISDTIPTWFAYLASIPEYFNASNNQIIGSFPKLPFSTFNLTHNSTRSRYSPFWNYETLDLSRNSISGSVNFLCDCPYLVMVDLSDNQLSNELPECFANFEFLRSLNLANNNFLGKIPDSFGFLNRLSWLHLRNNSFSGGIPTSMKNCTNLEMLDLGENKLTGIIPSWIGDGFSHLALLSVSSNEFFGNIASSICSLQTLQILDFSSNNISGPIPKCISNLTAMTSKSKTVQYSAFVLPYPDDWIAYNIELQGVVDGAKFMWKGTDVKYVNNLELVKLIDLSNNNLTGKIPAEITKLHDLIGLNLSRNNLIGSIPQNIGELKSLDFLDLSRNHLSGGIPTSLSDLSYLGPLNLSYNNLSGRIPQNSHMLTFEESSYAGNPGLCGRPLKKSCPGDDETSQQSNLNPKHEEEDDDDRLITKEFYIAMGVGFVIGFWGIFGTILILFNKTVRFAFLKVLNRIEDCVYVRVRVELRKASLRRHFQN